MTSSLECDVLVVGGGAGALTGALTAATLGLDVILAEKTEYLGGTAAYAGAGLWLPLNSVSAAAFADTREKSMRILLRRRMAPDLPTCVRHISTPHRRWSTSCSRTVRRVPLACIPRLLPGRPRVYAERTGNIPETAAGLGYRQRLGSLDPAGIAVDPRRPRHGQQAPRWARSTGPPHPGLCSCRGADRARGTVARTRYASRGGRRCLPRRARR